MCVQRRGSTQKQEGPLTREGKYTIKLANRTRQEEGRTSKHRGCVKVASLGATPFPFLRFHIYPAAFKFKFNFSVFPDLDKEAVKTNNNNEKKNPNANNLPALKQ